MDQSVSKVTEQLSQKLDPQEVDSLVQSPRRTEGVAGHRLCVYLQQFEGLEPEVQVTKSGSLRDSRNESLCECTPQLFMMWMMFWRPNRRLQRIQTNFGSKGRTKIGPVLQVKTTCYLDIHGIEIQETVPHLRLAYPEAQTAAWKSYDAMIQIILQKILN